MVTGCSLENGLMNGLPAFDMTWKSAMIYGCANEKIPHSTLKGFDGVMVQLLKKSQKKEGG